MLRLLAGSLSWSVLVAGRPADVCASGCTSDRDENSALQLGVASRRTQQLDEMETLRVESDEVHVTFVVDCHPHNLWQSEMLFFSAQHVGQQGPITQIVSGCSPERQTYVEHRHKSLGLPGQFKVAFVPEFNTKSSHVINKVYGFEAWFRKVGPDRDVVAIIDPDFIFLRPLTAMLNDAKGVYGWEGTPMPQKVEKGVVAAQRWPMLWPTHNQQPWLPKIDKRPDNMTDFELMAWICSGSVTGDSGCARATREEASFYQSTGVPYLAHKADFDEWFLQSWVDITTRLVTVYKGYYIDMWSWIMTGLHHRKRQFAVVSLMLREPGVKYREFELEYWAPVDELKVSACTGPMSEVLGSASMPAFLHYCQPQNGMWNKYWFDWGHNEGPHVLERCNATADAKGFPQLLGGEVVAKDRRHEFIPCLVRRMFAASLKRTCAGFPAAQLVDAIAANFTL
mmetsp:Transcript_23713/g.68197  ORF Transcript_23713/g.68197 Transcript_23713/m.68197 type:complete len:453 (+) Transcript_23713:58-1416(+)